MHNVRVKPLLHFSNAAKSVMFNSIEQGEGVQ